MVVQVAVLDDYQDFAPAHFDKLSGSTFAVRYFPETLRPYNHPDTPQHIKDELVSRLKPFEVISTMRERTPFPKELIDRLPRLKLLLSTGLRNLSIDMDACQARGIPVTAAWSKPLGPIDSTSEHIVTMILAVCRQIAQNDAAVKSGLWQTGFATGVSGKTLGLVGLGKLGSSIARIMHTTFGMKIIAWSPNLTQLAADEKAEAHGLPVELPNGNKTFEAVSREQVFEGADVVSVHLTLSERSRGLITKSDLSRMKPSSFFVNTSRGPLVVEEDLLGILRAGKIRGAALDVFDLEPLPADSEWRSADWGKDGKSQVLVTPHVAYVEERAIGGWYEQQVQDLLNWSSGRPLNKTMY